MIKRIAIVRLNELYPALGAAFMPIEADGGVEFRRWSEGARVRLDALNTTRSCKDLFFPQVDEMARFKLEGQSIEIKEREIDDGEFAIFGVRACDARSFELLDRVFLAEPADALYKARREAATIITNACFSADKTCFCEAFGIDPTSPGGDVMTYLMDGYLYWEYVTEKGARLTRKLGDLLSDCEKPELPNKPEQLSLDLGAIEKLGELDMFKSEDWDALAMPCLGCGACTFVCPTCQCYDIRDYDTGHGVQRYRCWDSCMYSDFTMMAHGTPRPTQKERFRQRFMHKLKYFPLNNEGLFSCVGCGRCVRQCPANMNIVRVIRKFEEADKNGK